MVTPERDRARRDGAASGSRFSKTYAHETDSGSQGGPLVGLSYKNVDVGGYVFDVSQDRPTFVIAAGLRF